MSALDTRESTTSAGWKTWWLPLCVLVPLSPWIAVYLRQIWRIESLRFFPLLFVLVGYLLAKRYTTSGSGLSQKLGYTIGAGGCTIAIGGALLNSPWLVWVGTVCMLAIVAGQWRHRVDAHAAWPLWGLLWLTVRMPGDFSQRFMQKLQSISTRASSVLLDFLGVMHYRAGNVIEVPGQRFMVEEACSGVQSLYSLIFVAISLAVLYRRSFAQAIVLSVAAAFWACVMNVLRILTVILGREWFEQDWTSGWQHDLVGYIALAVAIGLLFSTDRLLFLLSGPVMENDGDVQTGRNVNPLILFYNRVIGGGVGPWYEQKRSPFESSEVETTLPSKASWVPTLACSCLIGVVGVPHLWTMNVEGKSSLANDLPEIALVEGSLPKSIGDWTLAKFEKEERGWDSSFGRRSSIWHYRHPGQDARVSLDYYFENWHDLMVCYLNIGWEVQERKLEPPENANDPWQTITLFMTDKNGNKALLHYTLFTVAGQPLESPLDTPKGMFFNRFGLLQTQVTAVQAQVFVPLLDYPSETVREQTLTLHRRTREVLRDEIAKLDAAAQGGAQ